MARKVCTVEGCLSLVQGRGYCPNHYQRWRRNGDPTMDARSRVVVRPDGTRNCTKCGEVKSPAEFCKNRLGTGGLSPWCRPCMSAAERASIASIAANADRNRRRRADREAARRAAKANGQQGEEITRDGLRARDGDQCPYCGTLMNFSTHTRQTRPSNSASVDHILPLSRGGAHAWSNVVLCCIGCNVRKGNRIAPELANTHPSRKDSFK